VNDFWGRRQPTVENLVDGCSIHPSLFRECHLAARPLNLGTEQLNNLFRVKWSLQTSARLANGGGLPGPWLTLLTEQAHVRRRDGPLSATRRDLSQRTGKGAR
jgi:hypothetical protein